MKLAAGVKRGGEEDGGDEEEEPGETAEARGRAIWHGMAAEHIKKNVVPTLIGVKMALAASASALQKDLMQCLTVCLWEFRNELEDYFPSRESLEYKQIAYEFQTSVGSFLS